MLVRRPYDGSEAAIHQEQHALISGIMAAAWRPALDPRLIAAITMHDAPWRPIDAAARREDGHLVDFVAYPIGERLEFYAAGITQLEPVDPYIAYMVSLHYASFAGTAVLGDFVASEQVRRDRLAPLLGERLRTTEEDLRWLKFFDVLSLHVCLTGPDVPAEHLPSWLRETSHWSTAPDERALELRWQDEVTLLVAPFPFSEQLDIDIQEVTKHGPRRRPVSLKAPG